MKILKADEMSLLDRKTIEEIGLPSLVLMENASRCLLFEVEKRFKKGKVLVVAGKGNNGGDGLALARHLHLRGWEVDVYLPLGQPRGDALHQLNILKKLGLEPLKEKPDFSSYGLLVDALFGTGFKPPAEGKASEVIEEINKSGAKVVSVDIPSGLSADSGEVNGPAVRANLTVTFQFPKVCHVLFPSAELCGEVVVCDISIPPALASDIPRELLRPDSLVLPARKPDTYKTREGHVLIVGASAGKTGAVALASRAATRAGAGLVTAGIPEDLNPILESILIEEMTLPLRGKERLSFFAVRDILSEAERYSVLGLGMGMGRYEEGQDIVLELLRKWEKPIVLDADGINNLADSGKLEVLKERKIPAVLTPHIGEFARLTGYDSAYIIPHQIDVALEFSLRWRSYLVLKGARTVISTPEGRAFVFAEGTPALAKGGTGDVLTGIICALIPKLGIEDALKLGVFLHGLAGRLAEEKLHTESVGASDVVESIPFAFRELQKGVN